MSSVLDTTEEINTLKLVIQLTWLIIPASTLHSCLMISVGQTELKLIEDKVLM